jgi:hypothetical protein
MESSSTENLFVMYLWSYLTANGIRTNLELFREAKYTRETTNGFSFGTFRNIVESDFPVLHYDAIKKFACLGILL